MPLDVMEPSTLLDLEVHRRNRYPFLLYCPRCTRSYLSRKKSATCIFCEGPVTIVAGHFRHIAFCEHCDTRIERDEPIFACATCGKRTLTLYRWDMLSTREKKRIRLARFMQHAAQRIRLRRPSLRLRRAPRHARPAPAPLVSASQLRPRQRRGEELPSDQVKSA